MCTNKVSAVKNQVQVVFSPAATLMIEKLEAEVGRIKAESERYRKALYDLRTKCLINGRANDIVNEALRGEK